MKVLVLHGPNLNLLGERPGDAPGQTLAALDAKIRKRALALGLTVRMVQSNHEGALVDSLHRQRRWMDAVVVSPGALARSGWVLREALEALAKPALEVHLDDPQGQQKWRSVLEDICVGQVRGKGFDSYLEALERLAAPSTAKATAPKAKVKEKAGKAAAKQAASDGSLTRAAVRQKIAERLGGKLSPSGLSTWARSRWLDVQRGAPAESGQRELLEDSLQQLVLAAIPPARLTDEQLLELMTQLDEG